MLFAEECILVKFVDMVAGMGGNRSPTCVSDLLLQIKNMKYTLIIEI